jgi:hypothetical protein
MRLGRQNQGNASIFPRQEPTRHGDRRPPYPLFFSRWRKRWRRCGALPSLRNTGLGATVAWCGGFCDDVCGPLCLSVLPDVFEAAGGTMRSCRTHISGMSSLFFRRASSTLDNGLICLQRVRSDQTYSSSHRKAIYSDWIFSGILISGQGNIFETKVFILPSWIK